MNKKDRADIRHGIGMIILNILIAALWVHSYFIVYAYPWYVLVIVSASIILCISVGVSFVKRPKRRLNFIKKELKTSYYKKMSAKKRSEDFYNLLDMIKNKDSRDILDVDTHEQFILYAEDSLFYYTNITLRKHVETKDIELSEGAGNYTIINNKTYRSFNFTGHINIKQFMELTDIQTKQDSKIAVNCDDMKKLIYSHIEDKDYGVERIDIFQAERYFGNSILVCYTDSKYIIFPYKDMQDTIDRIRLRKEN